MSNRLLAAGGVFGLVGVAMGAFGAHLLKERILAAALEQWKTGAHYHQIHAVAMLAAAALAASGRQRAGTAGWFFAAGIVVFSGSLYALALSGLRFLGAITPIGGALMMIGWGLLAWSAYERKARDA